MTRTITPIAHELAKITQDGEVFLGVHLGSASKIWATKQFADNEQSEGWIIRGDQIELWKPKGFLEQDGKIYLYGAFHPGRTVQEVLNQSPDSATAYLYRLSKAINVFGSQDLKLPKFQSNGVLFLDEGGELFLPAALMERIRSTLIEADRIDTYELYNHPDLPQEQELSFSLGVLAYRVLTGALPYEAENEEELHQKMRDLEILSPKMRNPEITDEISDTIMRALKPGKKTEARPDTVEWEAKLKSWNETGFSIPLGEEHRRQILENAARIEKRAQSSYRTRSYLRRNARLLTVIGIAVIGVGLFAGSMIRNALQPRVTLDKSPLEVVQIFYDGITGMDHQAVEDSVEGDAGKGEVSEATNLYVISRVRMGQEGTSGQYPAQQWKDDGMPELRDGYYVYGISDLKITAESEEVFLAEYEKWQQATADTLSPEAKSRGYMAFTRKDRLYLRWDGKYWVIYQIDRLRDEIINN